MFRGWFSHNIGIVRHSPLFQRWIGATFWLLLGTSLARAIGIISTLVVARMMGRVAYGEVGIVLATITMFQISASLSLGGTASRYIAWYRTSTPDRVPGIVFIALSSTLIAAFITVTGLYMGSNWLAENSLSAPNLAFALRIASVSLFCLALRSCFIGILAGFEEFSWISKLTVATNLLNAPLIILGAWKWGVQGYFIGLAVGYVLGIFAHAYVTLRTIVRQGFSISQCVKAPKEWSILIHYTLPTVLSGAIITPALWYCKTVLVRQPGGYGAMGSFSAGSQVMAIVTLLTMNISQSSSPIMCNLLGSQQYRRYMKVFWTGLISSIGIAVILGGTIALGAPMIMSAFGRDFQADHHILYILAPLVILQTIDQMLKRVIASRGRQWGALFLSFLWAFILLLACWLWIPEHLAQGLAGGMLVAYFIRIIFSITYIRFYISALRSNEKAFV